MYMDRFNFTKVIIFLLTLLIFWFHVAGMGITFIMWYVGGACALPLGKIFPPSPKQLNASIQYPKLTKMCSVPLFLKQLIKLFRQDNNRGFSSLARLQFVLSTGAACSPNISQELAEHGVNLIIAYGPTGKLKVRPFHNNTMAHNVLLRKQTNK
jgi:acyl-coenzyme A synthetase/AMP-(fatty) acid ligase